MRPTHYFSGKEVGMKLQAVKDGQRQGGALTIKHTAARKGKGKGPAGKAGPPGSDLERKVVNCLSCGKVFDFRLAGAGQLTNDLLRFLGQPTFSISAVLYCTAIHMSKKKSVKKRKEKVVQKGLACHFIVAPAPARHKKKAIGIFVYAQRIPTGQQI